MKNKMLSNAEIAQILSEMAAFYDMEKVDFKKRAYEMAAFDVRIFPDDLTGIYNRDGLKGLTKVPNVGPGIAKHIEELLTTGKFREYEEFKKKIPVALSELMQLQGVGPRKIRDLWLHLKIRNVADLEKACRSGKVRKLQGFGVKSETKILQSIEALNGTPENRV